MKVRAALLIVALLPIGAAGSSLAATKPKPKPVKQVCNIITDASGDATYNNVPGDGNDDIVSGDLSSDGKTITAVIRLAGLAQPDPQWLPGQGYFMEFSVKGAENVLFLSARTYPQGTSYVFGYQAADPNTGVNTSYTIGQATGSVDTAKKEVHISAPNAAFAPAGSKLPLGVKILGPTAATYRLAGQGFVPSQNVGPERVPLGGLLLPFDTAAGTSYTVGVPSCVKPGH